MDLYRVGYVTGNDKIYDNQGVKTGRTFLQRQLDCKWAPAIYPIYSDDKSRSKIKTIGSSSFIILLSSFPLSRHFYNRSHCFYRLDRRLLFIHTLAIAYNSWIARDYLAVFIHSAVHRLSFGFRNPPNQEYRLWADLLSETYVFLFWFAPLNRYWSVSNSLRHKIGTSLKVPITDRNNIISIQFHRLAWGV